jgi:hypothetical protein
MTSDASEELEFKIKLWEEIFGIGGLAAWIGPEQVIVRDDASALGDELYGKAIILLHDFMTEEAPQAFGISGEIRLHCSISVAVFNSERTTEPLPADHVGSSEGPSLAMFNGFLREEFAFNTLGGWCWNTDLGPGVPITPEELPEGYIGRLYSFVAYKEVQR